eukprot:TRINITY_DN4803_c0_g1_i3.p1 TRINITY_DN4803_c0_g1~~TRINITY_DN4803_c0_g1_i3.p1  ORF type:complete len:328 (-),score=68.78 TRINITY_DN4803_c0_g1_i3:1296-2279(-)
MRARTRTRRRKTRKSFPGSHGSPHAVRGWWEYSTLLEDPFSSVKRNCAIFKTLGNKRLGDNVITGLERLLPFLVHVDGSCFESLMSFFPKERIDPSGGLIFETYMVTLTGEFGGEQDFHEFPFKETVPEMKYPGMEEKWFSIWEESCQLLKSVPLNKGCGSLLAHLYWLFGRETGQIYSSFCSAKDPILWGTYVDELGHHCNAHVNNLVLLPPGHSHLLSPLDFDMAFTRESFTLGQEQFQNYQEMELNGLKLALADFPEVSTGVNATATLTGHHLVVKWALRDTMLRGFYSGFSGMPDQHPRLSSLDPYLYALLNLSLIVTEMETA